MVRKSKIKFDYWKNIECFWDEIRFALINNHQLIKTPTLFLAQPRHWVVIPLVNWAQPTAEPAIIHQINLIDLCQRENKDLRVLEVLGVKFLKIPADKVLRVLQFLGLDNNP